MAIERLAPGGVVCLMMTRWHTDDLAGRILSRPSPLRWRVLSMPAIAEDRDVLGRAPGEEFPSIRGRDPGYFANLQATLSAYTFASVYQQSPTAVAGNFFRRQAFRYWRMADGLDAAHRLRGGAISGAWIDCEGTRVDLIDCWRFATVDVAASTEHLRGLDRGQRVGDRAGRGPDPAGPGPRPGGDGRPFRDGPPAPPRSGSSTCCSCRASGATKTLTTDAQAAGIPVAEVVTDKDKVTRAIPAAARLHAGKVWFPAYELAPWVEKEWEPELLGFNKAAHDDQVDTFSAAARVASAHWVPPPPPKRHQYRAEPSQFLEQVGAAYAAATGNGHEGPPDLMNMPLG